ncbi:response regulator transcription factor [Bifidobacterium sp. MA2]|uniref:Response regulator transcription factor n=1 Tax=Bifidobacterium santillanense TaxID=2809028 RepID=A0ABS5UQG4_9BIFI|nr:response regulator transcription factor [Bifidobacterium santillanense]MBT1173208.1 response regulator transcription factor [Bifidobacterium santillanense]
MSLTGTDSGRAAAHRTGQPRRPVIALVDNDRMALLALSSLLTHAGFTIPWTAQLGAAAIQRCIRERDRPDVLLVDMALTDMTGVDVCRAVRRWTPTLPMIGMTAYDPAVYRDAAITAGATTVIPKDDFDGLVAAIREAAIEPGTDDSGAETRAPLPHQAATPRDPIPITASRGPISRHNGHDDAGVIPSVSSASSYAPSSTPRADAATPARSFALSPGQAAIMRLYADGRSTDEIAATLGISKGTIFSQVARVRDKLHARDRDEAVALCRRYLRM